MQLVNNCLATPHAFGLVFPSSIVAPTSGDTVALASLGNNQNRLRGGSSNSKSRPKCDHCNRLGHTIGYCWKLHGRPPRQVNAAQVDNPDTMQTSPSLHSPTPSYEDFLKWCQTNQASGSTASIAQLVIHLFVSLNHLLLVLRSSILVRLIMLPVIKVFSLPSLPLVSYQV